jgi:hypothetical protein
LFWGFGYVYLGQRARLHAILALVLGPILAFGSCTASFAGVGIDYEHPYYNSPATIQAANRAAVQTGLIVAAAVLFLAVDAWRLASLLPAETPEPEEH